MPRGTLLRATVDEHVERGASDAQRHPREAQLVECQRRQAVQWPRLPALVLKLARDRVIVTHEMIGQRELIAGSTAQADDVPDISPFDLRGWYEQSPHDLPALVVEPRITVCFEDRALRTHPGCVPAPAGESPHTGRAIAAFYRYCLRFGPGPQASTARGSPKTRWATAGSR